MTSIFPHIIPYLLIFALVALLIKITTPLFIKLSWLDHTNDRKKHSGSVPINGGLSMFIGFFIGLIFIFNNYDKTLILLLTSFLILMVGFIDDIYDSKVFTRLTFQILIVLLAIFIGDIKIHTFGDIIGVGNIQLGNWSIIVTILAFLAGMNALNWIDGIDGLASMCAIITFSAIIFFAHITNNAITLNICLFYLVILSAFLVFNLSKRKIFMGDSGSLFLGFGISWLLIDVSQSENPIFNPVTALWIFAVPLIDIIAVIILRLKNNTSLLLPDNNHIHHQILNITNLSSLRALLLITFLSFTTAIIGITGDFYNIPEWLMFIGFFTVLLIYLIFTFPKKNSF